jgi:long-chain acyl-CoA synthetase
MNLAIWLRRAADSHGDLPSIGVGARVVRTFAESAERAARLAGGLRDGLGLSTGDRVAIFAKNGPDYAETLYAIWWAGLAAVPINNKLHESEVAYILEHSEARAVFVSKDLVDTAAAGLPSGVHLIEFETQAHDRLLAGNARDLQDAEDDDLAWLFYTSGTTGRPKGAMLTHRNLAAMTWGYFAAIDRLEPGGAILHAAPMSHGSGIYILPHLARACCQVTPESGGFEPAEIFETIGHWPGTSMFAAPTMVNRLSRHDGPKDLDEPARDRLRRRADVCRRRAARARCLGAAPGSNLRPGRKSDDDFLPRAASHRRHDATELPGAPRLGRDRLPQRRDPHCRRGRRRTPISARSCVAATA